MLWALGLKRFIRKGSLTVTDAEGALHRFGKEGEASSTTWPSAAIRLHDIKLHRKLLLNPDLALGEAYMDSTLTLEEGTSLHDLLDVFGANAEGGPRFPWEALEDWLRPALSRLHQFNPLAKSRANVAHHYDLSEKLYRLFLDADMQYSCAYFAEGDTLEQAQERKKAHIAAKLLLKPGMKVLDIGCGWGGMAMYLARETGAHVTGITLSPEQKRVAEERVKAAGLQNQVEFFLRDYRHEKGEYDRIVSVGMFEHVGPHYYKKFFRQVNRLLKPDGVALLHSIGRADGPETTNPWLRKYIFPGAGAPALSEVMPAVEKAGLWNTDIEILRLHYAYTLAEWHTRFQAHRAEIAALYDERFCRMWEFYLVSAEMYFRYCGVMVFQMQLAKNINAVPVARDYMVDAERALMEKPGQKRYAAAA